LNLQPSGYEPDELPIAPPRDIPSLLTKGAQRYDFFLINASP
jgi:hypothetical protein